MKAKILILLLLLSIISAGAESVASLKTLCNRGESMLMQRDYIVDGIVVSDYRSLNMELNPSETANRLNVYVNDATAYIQDNDGKCGLRLVFDESSDNRLKRADKVRINIKGCRLTRGANPDCLTLSGLNWLNVEFAEPGQESDIIRKEKYISELTDDDLYTFVSLRDLEFVFKDGSYADIFELHSVYCPAVHRGKSEANGRMDGWASLLRDSQGCHIYMMVNMLCDWRRRGSILPQGIGNVDGIIVHTHMRRYGGDMGRYSIRPLDDKYIRIARKRESNWKCLTAWVQDGTAGQTLEFETLGLQDGLWKDGRRGDRILNDGGQTKGYLWTDSDAFVHVDSDLNSCTADKEGVVPNGAIMFKGTGTGWYTFDSSGRAIPDKNKSFFIEVDTRKVKGEQMTLNFSWVEGTGNPDCNWGFPAQWKVQCGIDGGNWITLKEAATGNDIINLRAHPWMDRKMERFGMRRTGFDTALGMQQRSFALPKDVIGKPKVFIRITPANDIYYAHRVDPKTSSVDPNKRIKSDMTYTKSFIRFGEISIDYK